MYSITVRDRCAYALSLKLGNAPLFRTGVTALVDAKLSGPELGPDGLLIDFVAVQLALGATLAGRGIHFLAGESTCSRDDEIA